MSLTKQDLKDIKGIVKETVSAEIDDFAVIVAKGFNEVHDKLIEHDQRFESIDQKLEKHDQKFEEHDDRFNYLSQKMDQNHRKVIEKISHHLNFNLSINRSIYS